MTNPTETIAKLGLTVTSEFIPFSQSRNAKEKHKSLNWKVTLNKDSRAILTTDYSAGSGHAPSYKQSDNTVNRAKQVEYECETGRNANYGARDKNITPNATDVIASLVMDSSVLDESSFEDWASSLGYETDSRKAEAIYRACLDIALKLRNGIGESGLSELREAFQDY